MSFYRVYRYPLADRRAYKHIYFYGRRTHKDTNDTDEYERNADAVREVCRMNESLSRTKRTVRDLMLCNKFDYFCTFTFSGDRVDRYNFSECRSKLTKLFNNYRSRYSPDFRYMVLPEFHKDGAVHFHGVVKGIRECDFTIPEYVPKRLANGELEMVPNTKQYVDWAYYSSRLGYFSCSKIEHYERCASYITKYVTKDLVLLPKGARALMTSSGLSRPELIFDNDGVPPRFNPSYHGDYCEIGYLSEDDTVKMGIITPWWSDGDNKTIVDGITENGISDEPVTYEQLRIRDVIQVERV